MRAGWACRPCRGMLGGLQPRKSGGQGPMDVYVHRPACLWCVHLRVRLTKPPQIARACGSGARCSRCGRTGCVRRRPAAIGAGFCAAAMRVGRTPDLQEHRRPCGAGAQVAARGAQPQVASGGSRAARVAGGPRVRRRERRARRHLRHRRRDCVAAEGKRRSRADGHACPSARLSMVRPPASSPYETSTNRRGVRVGRSPLPRRACGLRLAQPGGDWCRFRAAATRVGRTPDLQEHRGPCGACAAGAHGTQPQAAGGRRGSGAPSACKWVAGGVLRKGGDPPVRARAAPATGTRGQAAARGAPHERFFRGIVARISTYAARRKT